MTTNNVLHENEETSLSVTQKKKKKALSWFYMYSLFFFFASRTFSFPFLEPMIVWVLGLPGDICCFK